MEIQALWTAWWYTEICQDDLIYGHSHESKIGTIWEEEHRLRVRVSVILPSSVLKHRHYLCTKLQHEQMIDVPLSYLYDMWRSRTTKPFTSMLSFRLFTSYKSRSVYTKKSKKMETTFIFKEKIFSTESGFSSFGINFIHVLVELVILQPLKRNSSQITQWQQQLCLENAVWINPWASPLGLAPFRQRSSGKHPWEFLRFLRRNGFCFQNS